MENFENETNNNSTVYSDSPSEGTGASDVMKERAREVGSKVSEKVDEMRMKTSERLRRSSRSLEDLGVMISSKLDVARERGNVGLNGVSRGVERVASYIESHDSQELLADCKQVIRRHPGKSIIAGLLFGLFIGRAVR